MNILLFTLEYPPFKGGIANYYGNLVGRWPISVKTPVDKSDDVFVLHNNDGKLIKEWLWPKWLPAIWCLYKIIKNEKIDHVIVGHILPLGVATLIVSKFTKTSYSVVLHGMDLNYAQKTSRKRNLARKTLVKAKNIICTNSFVKKATEDFLNNQAGSKLFIVNPGIEGNVIIKKEIIEDIKNKHNLSGKMVLFSIGRLVKRKGFDNVIRAMPEILQSNPNLYYFIAGDGPDKVYLKELAKGTKNIIFLGPISDEEKWAWLSICDIFIMPSRDVDGDVEGFGIVYLEASLAGKPIVAGDSGGVRDAVLGAHSGILVDPENIDRIAGAVIGLSQDTQLRLKLGDQGRERVKKEFNWENQINKIFNIIHS